MSWQALTWAADQKTGSPHAKLLLLLLANRADENGICWPSQFSLAVQAEQSDDTVQRYLKTLEKAGFIVRARTRRTQGRWAGYVYQLLMPGAAAAGENDLQDQPSQARVRRAAIRRAKTAPLPDAQTSGTTPPTAVRSTPLPAVSPGRSQRCHQAAESGVEPVIEPSKETSGPESSATARVRLGSEASSAVTSTSIAEARLRALQGRKPPRLDLIHNQIASRLGPQGWSILQRLRSDQLAQIEHMERKGLLTDATLAELREEAFLLER